MKKYRIVELNKAGEITYVIEKKVWFIFFSVWMELNTNNLWSKEDAEFLVKVLIKDATKPARKIISYHP